jgi:peptidyl-prolyl cis-trans isomerase SurA
MIGRRELLGGLLALAPAVSLASVAWAQDNGVAAKVNGEAISTYDLVQRMRLLVALSGLKPDEGSVGWLQAFALSNLVDERLKIQEFERFRSLSVLDGDVDDHLRRMAGGDPAAMLARLGQDGVQAESLRSYVRGQTAWTALVEGRLGGRVQVSDEQAAQAAARLSAPDTAKVKVTGLLVSDAAAGDRSTALAMARQLAAQARSGAPLSDLEAVFGEPSVFSGGEQGRWIETEMLDPEVAAAAASAPLGAVTDPIEARGGVLLLIVLERYQPGGGSPPDVSLEAARRQTVDDRLTQQASRYLRDLRNQAEIVR